MMVRDGGNSTAAAGSALAGPAGSLLDSIRVWADMVKFAHSIFALPFALIAVFVASSLRWNTVVPTKISLLVLILICMVSARSVAMTVGPLVGPEAASAWRWRSR